MSLAILRCRAQYGTEAPPVTIEVFLSGGLPAFTIDPDEFAQALANREKVEKDLSDYVASINLPQLNLWYEDNFSSNDQIKTF